MFDGSRKRVAQRVRSCTKVAMRYARFQAISAEGLAKLVPVRVVQSAARFAAVPVSLTVTTTDWDASDGAVGSEPGAADFWDGLGFWYGVAIGPVCQD